MRRRPFLKKVVGAGLLLNQSVLSYKPAWASEEKLSCQQYTWSTFFKREKKEWLADLDTSFESLKRSGYSTFEPTFDSVDAVKAIKGPIQKHSVKVRSCYVNSILHDPDQRSKSIDQVLAIATAAKDLGAKIVVTNPSPIQWGGPENKSDRQLTHQAEALEELGSELTSLGLVLAYHNHDAEMREGAREFHHMLATDPDNVSLCLDSHWIFRGAGDSSVALFDIVDLYRDRIVELHLRQSRKGTWTETFGVGDIDYHRLAKYLNDQDIHPLIVMEQAVEEGTPHRMTAIGALSASRINAVHTFEKLM